MAKNRMIDWWQWYRADQHSPNLRDSMKTRALLRCKTALARQVLANEFERDRMFNGRRQRKPVVSETLSLKECAI